MNNPLTGLVILAALIAESPFVGTMGAFGLVVATGFAQLLQVDRNAISNGLLGFNGLLLGLALATFDSGNVPGAEEWSSWLRLLPVVTVMSMFTVVLTISLGNLLVPVFGVPAFTLPFNLSMFVFLGAAVQSSHFRSSLPPSLLAVPAAADGSGDGFDRLDWLMLLEAVPRGVGQVFLAEGTDRVLATDPKPPSAMTARVPTLPHRNSFRHPVATGLCPRGTESPLPCWCRDMVRAGHHGWHRALLAGSDAHRRGRLS